MSLAEGKMPTGSPIALPPGVVLTSQFDYTGTRNDASFSISVWARLGCPGVRFLCEHQHERLRGTPRAPSTLHFGPFASTPASEYLDSTETLETEPRATAPRRYDSRDNWR
jgi:hypothetical protein